MGRICVVCHEASKITQQIIDKMLAPLPEEPQVRAGRMIVFFHDWLKAHPKAPTRMKLHIVRQIRRQERLLREWMPTRYAPRADLKGGRS